MKRLVTIALFVVLTFSLVTTAQSQVLWRSAKTMNKGSAIVMAEWYLMSFNKSYDWTNEEWVDFPDGKESSTWGFETMFGYGITDKWEAMLHVPILFKSSELAGVETDASGIGDMYLKTRYSVMPWAKDTHGLTLTGCLRLPTGDEKADIPLGDGSTDFALGGIFSTAWMNGFRGHLKANYWINGENDDKVKMGNELKLIFKLDYNLNPKVMPFVTFIPYMQSKKEVDGTEIANSEKSRYSLCLGGMYKPRKGLFIRPKLTFPLGGEGGSLYSVKPIIDIWYVFPLVK